MNVEDVRLAWFTTSLNVTETAVFGSDDSVFFPGVTESIERLVWFWAMCEDWAGNGWLNTNATEATAKAQDIR